MSNQALLDDVEKTIAVYENEIGGFANRTRNMISQHGPLEALSRLVISPDLQKGFKILRDRGLLQTTFEALVVRHQDLFDTSVVEAAKWRLENPHQLF